MSAQGAVRAKVASLAPYFNLFSVEKKDSLAETSGGTSVKTLLRRPEKKVLGFSWLWLGRVGMWD